MDETMFKIVLCIVSLLATIVTSVIIPYIKEKIGNEKLSKYEYWASMAVNCAEMIFAEQGMGKAKKEYVVGFLNQMFNKDKIVITEEQIEILVEACVKQMKMNEN